MVETLANGNREAEEGEDDGGYQHDHEDDPEQLLVFADLLLVAFPVCVNCCMELPSGPVAQFMHD